MDETRDPKYYPTRLLDIGGTDSQSCRLLVVENGRPTDNGSYVALSHCWGKAPCLLTLTSDNMDELQQGIALHPLPNSFVDSIQNSRRLGFRYLWIDSLRIIQSGRGLEEDWRMHASTMELIYANCELNLAVARAANVEQGAFADRDPDFLQTAFVYVPVVEDPHNATNISSSDGSKSEISTVVDPATGDKVSIAMGESESNASMSRLVMIFARNYDFQSALWELPLQRRGWVIQERVMAPRTLYFGRDRIYWECRERIQNEYLPWGLPEAGNLFDEDYRRDFCLPHAVLKPTPNQLTEDDMAFIHMRWHKLVTDYSCTDLTYPKKDKLIAISTIAKRFGRALSSQYTAGLFYSDLPLGLL